MNRSIGMSLIEVLFSLTILSIISLGVIQWAAENKEKELIQIFSNDINALLSSFDKRLIIDSFSPNNIEKQLDHDKFSDVIKDTFVSRDHDCGNKSSGWEPLNGENLILLPCDMWKSKVPYGFQITSDVKIENERVNSVTLVLSLSKKNLERNPSLIIHIGNELLKKVNTNMIGTQSYSLIDSNGDRINKMECLKLSYECSIKAEFKVTPMFILNK